jgi:EmrB/QacA subfamily drug resistance transporter
MREDPMHRKHTRPAAEDAAQKSGNPKLLAILLVAQLMVILDITAVNIALPSLARDLHLGGSTISWVITSYSLLFGSLLLLGGRAADLLGRRRMFLFGLVFFTLNSLAAAEAANATMLFLARAGQGIGAAMLSPAALSIITTRFHGPARAKALAAWGAIGGAGAAIGVLVGGVLTQAADWRLIFYVNLPVAVCLVLLARNEIPHDDASPNWMGLDLRGAAIGTGSLAAIVFAITQADSVGWMSPRTFAVAAAGIFGLVLFALCERKTADPLLRIERLADRARSGGLFLMLAGAGSIFGLFYLCSLYLQDVLGHGPLTTGLAFIPLALSAGVGAHAAGHIVGRHGVRGPLAVAFTIGAAGMLMLSRVSQHGSYLHDVLPGMLVAGFGLGIAIVSVSVAILTGAKEEESGMLSGLNSTGHEIGGTLGIAIFGSIAAAASGGLAGPNAATAIGHAFLAAGGIATLGALTALAVLPHAKHFLPKLRLNPAAMPIH